MFSIIRRAFCQPSDFIKHLSIQLAIHQSNLLKKKSASQLSVHQAIHWSSCPTRRPAISLFLVHQASHPFRHLLSRQLMNHPALNLAIQPCMIQPCQSSILSFSYLTIYSFIALPIHLFIRNVIHSSTQPVS